MESPSHIKMKQSTAAYYGLCPCHHQPDAPRSHRRTGWEAAEKYVNGVLDRQWEWEPSVSPNRSWKSMETPCNQGNAQPVRYRSTQATQAFRTPTAAARRLFAHDMSPLGHSSTGAPNSSPQQQTPSTGSSGSPQSDDGLPICGSGPNHKIKRRYVGLAHVTPEARAVLEKHLPMPISTPSRTKQTVNYHTGARGPAKPAVCTQMHGSSHKLPRRSVNHYYDTPHVAQRAFGRHMPASTHMMGRRPVNRVIFAPTTGTPVNRHNKPHQRRASLRKGRLSWNEAFKALVEGLKLLSTGTVLILVSIVTLVFGP